MTLLELLRQELPKRGGWPEGADYCVQHAHDLGFCWVIFDKGIISRTSADDEGMWDMDWNFSRGRDFCADELASDHATAIVTREQYEATGWDGVGLPPIGVECEYQYKVHGSEWCSFECVAVDGNAAFGWSNNTPTALQLNTHNFRPLRTEAERAIDEMVRLSGVSIGAAKILYDAGYRKG